MIKIAICDDEKVYRDVILDYINSYESEANNLNIVQFECGEDIIEQYKNGQTFDLIFLDVEMKQLSGVETGKVIREVDKNVMFVFITNHQQYVPDAFVLNAFQFLLKPLNQDLFNREFERALNTYNKMKFQYKIVYKEQVNVLKTGDILYIETYDRHLRATTQNQKYKYLGNISAEEIKLQTYNFIRCHKCYLVNMKHITNISNNDFIMSNGDIIPISKRLKHGVISSFNRYISGGCV